MATFHFTGKAVDTKAQITSRAHVNQLAVFVVGDSRVFAGEVTDVDNETGQILAAYITGGRMLRFTLGQPPTSRLLRDWTDKQTVFSLCPRNGWKSLVEARDVLEPLYREWKEKQGEQAERNEQPDNANGLTDEQRKAWLAKYSIPRPVKMLRPTTAQGVSKK